jgi:signal transduction histidine kinase
MGIEEQSDFEVRRQLLQMEMLYEIGVAINESLDPTHVADEILQRAVVMVDARGGALLVREEGEGEVRLVGQIGMGEDMEEVLKLTEVEEAWGQAELVQKEMDGHRWKHLCLVPLESGQEVNGLLVVADREHRGGAVGPFSENDESLLHSFAYQAGAALHNARLHHNLEEAYEELQIAQRKLAQMEQLRALGDLAADLAHAMAHVMGIIIGRADMYLNFQRDPEKTIQGIMAAAENGQEVISRIQQCTRLGVGKKREARDINELMEEAVVEVRDLWHQRHGEDGPDIEWQIELGELSETFINPTDMREVFVNLLLNGLEAMPEGGQVAVETREQGGELGIEVRDTGDGMTDEVKDQIFQPFYTTKEEMGTGLGLSIVYRIIDDHGGEIDVQSAPGQGTRFAIKLPVNAEAPAESGEGKDGESDLDR